MLSLSLYGALLGAFLAETKLGMAAFAAASQSASETAEGNYNSKVCDMGGDDWVSLVLSDVGVADHSVSLSSLANFPLPDLDDMDFSNLDSSVGSHGFTPSWEGHSYHSDVLFDSSRMLQDMENCPSLYGAASHGTAFPASSDPDMPVCPTLPHSSKEIAVSHSPESGLSGVSYDYLDGDIRIPTLDSSSDDDSLFFLVSDICPEETASAEVKHYDVEEVAKKKQGDCGEHSWGGGLFNVLQVDMDTSQPSTCQQLSSTCSKNKGTSASIGHASRKRKHVDPMSGSSMPEEMTAECSEKEGNSIEEGDEKEEEEERRQARLIRNRESAQLSRQRKKVYVDELEEKIKTMASTIAELKNTITLISAENINLRRQLGLFGPPPGQTGGIANVAPWMGAYSPGPMMGGRLMLPGAHVPLVPIPRWKSQQPSPGKKTKKPKSEPQEKSASVKAIKRTKKVAGIAAAGLFFFVFILLPINFQFLGLRPIVQRESRVWVSNPWHVETSNVGVRAGARVLTGLSDERDLMQNERDKSTGYTSPEHAKAGEYYWDVRKASKGRIVKACDSAETYRKNHSSGFEMNASAPLAATLFVPRSDGLVRIEGNLIIHSVLAGDKAAESVNQTRKQNVRTPALYERGHALRANLKALAIEAAPGERGALVDLQKALAGKLRYALDGGSIKSVKEDGSLQQWFVEDFTGPVFSSGMCTEVFQFEISPATSSSSTGSGSHVTEANDLAKKKSTLLEGNGPRKAGRSGKSLPSYAVPLPPVGHKVVYNATTKNGSFAAGQGGFEADEELAKQKHGRSSVVVSVLAGSDLGEQSMASGGNGLSQIFVVVLIDSVKYVTYSCMVPSSGAKFTL